MKIQVGTDLSLYLLNFSDAERGNFAFAAQEIFKATGGKYGFPGLRSQEIYVLRNMFDVAPRYLSEPASEFISVKTEENKPLKFAYQLAHETGHLMAQSWQRHNKPGHYSWIEEAICGAYSIYCMRELSKIAGWWNTEGEKYLRDYIDKAYAAIVIDASWYNAHCSHLAGASSLTDIIKPLSRLLADEFHGGEFVLDNMALIGMPPLLNVVDYLRAWESRCARSPSVPTLLRSRLEIG